jgi:hypothetical protein
VLRRVRVSHEVIRAVTVVSPVETICKLVSGYLRFGSTYCLRAQTEGGEDVEISTALNCLNNPVVERNALSGNITCRDYRRMTSVDKPIYLAWSLGNNSLSIYTLIINFCCTWAVIYDLHWTFHPYRILISLVLLLWRTREPETNCFPNAAWAGFRATCSDIHKTDVLKFVLWEKVQIMVVLKGKAATNPQLG